MFLADMHTHSRHSFDGRDNMAALCQGALDAGLSALCVTDHYDSGSLFDPAAYRAEFEETRAAFAGRLELLLGVELGEGHHTKKRSEKLLDSVPFDFVLGSCHALEGQPDFYGTKYTSQAHCRRLIGAYLDELPRMIAWGGFDALGHLTYPLRYMTGCGFGVDFLGHTDQVCGVFRALAESGRGMEVNVSGLRRDSFAMPDLPLLKLFRDCGGEIVTVGSDAHRAGHIGARVGDGYALLRAAGFTRAAVYRGRQVQMVDI